MPAKFLAKNGPRDKNIDLGLTTYNGATFDICDSSFCMEARIAVIECSR